MFKPSENTSHWCQEIYTETDRAKKKDGHFIVIGVLYQSHIWYQTEMGGSGDGERKGSLKRERELDGERHRDRSEGDDRCNFHGQHHCSYSRHRGDSAPWTATEYSPGESIGNTHHKFTHCNCPYDFPCGRQSVGDEKETHTLPLAFEVPGSLQSFVISGRCWLWRFPPNLKGPLLLLQQAVLLQVTQQMYYSQ